MPHFEDWSIGGNPYQSPQQRVSVVLQGKVIGHAEHTDGTSMCTSKIMGYDAETEEFIAYSGSRYTIGEIDSAYETLYPDARAGLIAAFTDTETEPVQE